MIKRIFVSSVQKEFAEERRMIRGLVLGNPLLRRFFDVFLFEDLPASDRRADEVYLDEVRRCDVFVGLFGYEYGAEGAGGLSPTEREFDEATAQGKNRLIFVKGGAAATRHERMHALISRAGAELIRRRFQGGPELTAALYASLVEHLDRTGRLRTKPFAAAACPDASFDDLSADELDLFLARAQSQRGYVLGPGTPMRDVLAHLNLLDGDRPTHAAVLLFGKEPQRFLLTSEVKCAHFHGTEVRKPIPSYQVYKGTLFALVDQAVDFVMSKIARTVGTRQRGPEAPVDYELLQRPHASIPRNPLIAEPMFLARYAEKAGSGILDMIARCREAGLPAPRFRQEGGQFIQTLGRSRVAATPEVAPEVAPEVRLARTLVGEMTRQELQRALALKDGEHFRKAYLQPAIDAGLVEMTIPDKPRSSRQKYRLTERGRDSLARESKGGPR